MWLIAQVKAYHNADKDLSPNLRIGSPLQTIFQIVDVMWVLGTEGELYGK